VAAYRATGTVWRAGAALGVPGQAVRARLHAIGYRVRSSGWADDEVAELRAGIHARTVGELANHLGRSCAEVAAKIFELGITARGRSGSTIKIPRGAGYDKASCARYIREIDATHDVVALFARRNALNVPALCAALERHFPQWWTAYRDTHEDLLERDCAYCEATFIPSNGNQIYCSPTCARNRQADVTYFGGRRREAIGMAQNRCQMCGKTGGRGLTPHHVLGKDNDPEDAALIALCPGCHQLVTLLGGRRFLDEPRGWESLIQLAYLRRNGAVADLGAVRVYVEIVPMSTAETAAELEADSLPVRC
jgi:hypothetical protein